ncbi:Hypothetical predicted protein [Cloeon dipterum]|uniref:Uncharacterized protein n=1 Tax=Cloeon dipterum TaxID=197152 RepID=A0A8S1D594_9INSE|nr:Hypothetical predicted protein [Cloeon dipterum]
MNQHFEAMLVLPLESLLNVPGLPVSYRFLNSQVSRLVKKLKMANLIDSFTSPESDICRRSTFKKLRKEEEQEWNNHFSFLQCY